ncbi:hypothetical protein [Microvirga sesbaniae]|uniref:hypothetical protein n=1 Tax=Microvirga sesbaniae TaxID=681392 RepID=UPI0021C62380|nr:hypothetical protein [Microvirga sp. HBU67692]
MTTLTIGNREVEVSDDFLKLSPEQQNATVEEIAQSLGVTGDDAGSDTAEAPELTAGRAAGLTGRAGVQAVPGAIAGLPALAYDGTIGFLENMTRQAYNVGARALGAQEVPYRDPFKMTNAVSSLGEAGADALGLPKPETEGERIAVAGGQTALEALSGAGLAKVGAKTVEGGTRRVFTELADAPFTQAAIGGLAGTGAQTAVENDVNPLLGTVGGLALGVTGAAVPTLARQGFQSATNALDQALLRSPEAQARAARARIFGAASDPDAALRELEEGAGAELVPGSRPTTFQATGDMGLGSLERELQTNNPEVFAQRRADQNSARLESLRSVQGEGSSEDIVTFLKGQLDEIDRVTGDYEAKARAAAEEATDAIRFSEDADGIGNSIRGAMKEAEDEARRREKSLWEAVDPDGSLTVPTQGAREAAHRVYGNMTRAAEIGLTPEERSIRELIGSYGPVEAFRELNDLASQIKAAMRAELSSPGRGRTPAYARLAQLNEALRSAITKSAAERISTDPAIGSKFAQWANEWADATGRNASEGNGAVRAVRQGGVPGVGREEGPFSRGSGSPTRNQGVQNEAGLRAEIDRLRDERSRAFDQAVAAQQRGDTAAFEAAKARVQELDGPINDLTSQIPVKSTRANHTTGTFDDEPKGNSAAVSRQLQKELQGAGVRPEEISPQAFNDAVERLARSEEADAITAYERAVMSLEDEGPVGATYAPRAGRSAGSLLDGFNEDPEAGKRYDAATKATRERVGTFNKGYAGQILRKEGDKDTFRMGPGSVTKNAFMPGATGGERVKALVKAGAKHSDIAEAAALSLSKHIKDGVLDPKGFQRWRQQYQAALQELPPDVRARFANASLASETLNQVAALRKAKLDAFNKSVLGRLAKVDTADLPGAIGRILNGADANKQMAQLVAAANKNPNAKEGLRRAVAEYVQERFISNKEVGASGENAIRADAFQGFIRSKKGALTLVFGQEHVLRLQAIADDIKRSERSLQAVRTPGNSNTAQDIGAALDKHAEKAGKSSLFSQILVAAGGGALIGDFTGAAVGAAGAGLKGVLGSMRAAGLKKVDDLVLEMMLDPQLAKAALLKAPVSSKAAQRVLRQSLERIGKSAATGAGYAAPSSNNQPIQ